LRLSRPNRIKLALAAFALIALLGWIIWLTRQRDRVVPWNTPIQLDDFFFSVVDVKEIPGAPTGQQRYVVSFKVDNRAKRVPYQFRREMVTAIDERDRRFSISAAGQRLLDESRPGPDPCAAPLPAGRSAVTELVIDLPDDVREPGLKFAFGPVGDALEAIVSGPKRFTLRREGGNR
jgi:hypothetical protein